MKREEEQRFLDQALRRGFLRPGDVRKAAGFRKSRFHTKTEEGMADVLVHLGFMTREQVGEVRRDVASARDAEPLAPDLLLRPDEDGGEDGPGAEASGGIASPEDPAAGGGRPFLSGQRLWWLLGGAAAAVVVLVMVLLHVFSPYRRALRSIDSGKNPSDAMMQVLVEEADTSVPDLARRALEADNDGKRTYFVRQIARILSLGRERMDAGLLAVKRASPGLYREVSEGIVAQGAGPSAEQGRVVLGFLGHACAKPSKHTVGAASRGLARLGAAAFEKAVALLEKAEEDWAASVLVRWLGEHAGKNAAEAAKRLRLLAQRFALAKVFSRAKTSDLRRVHAPLLEADGQGKASRALLRALMRKRGEEAAALAAEHLILSNPFALDEVLPLFGEADGDFRAEACFLWLDALAAREDSDAFASALLQVAKLEKDGRDLLARFQSRDFQYLSRTPDLPGAWLEAALEAMAGKGSPADVGAAGVVASRLGLSGIEKTYPVLIRKAPSSWRMALYASTLDEVLQQKPGEFWKILALLHRKGARLAAILEGVSSFYLKRSYGHCGKAGLDAEACRDLFDASLELENKKPDFTGRMMRELAPKDLERALHATAGLSGEIRNRVLRTWLFWLFTGPADAISGSIGTAERLGVDLRALCASMAPDRAEKVLAAHSDFGSVSDPKAGALLSVIKDAYVNEAFRKAEKGGCRSLPRSRPGPSSGILGLSILLVENDTDEVMTLLYTGPETFRVSIGPKGKAAIQLLDGTYRIIVRVSEKTVEPFVGTETYVTCLYGVRYYIHVPAPFNPGNFSFPKWDRKSFEEMEKERIRRLASGLKLSFPGARIQPLGLTVDKAGEQLRSLSRENPPDLSKSLPDLDRIRINRRNPEEVRKYNELVKLFNAELWRRRKYRAKLLLEALEAYQEAFRVEEPVSVVGHLAAIPARVREYYGKTFGLSSVPGYGLVESNQWRQRLAGASKELNGIRYARVLGSEARGTLGPKRMDPSALTHLELARESSSYAQSRIPVRIEGIPVKPFSVCLEGTLDDNYFTMLADSRDPHFSSLRRAREGIASLLAKWGGDRSRWDFETLTTCVKEAGSLFQLCAEVEKSRPSRYVLVLAGQADSLGVRKLSFD